MKRAWFVVTYANRRFKAKMWNVTGELRTTCYGEHFRFFEGHESRFNISLNISFGSGQTECLNILLQRCPEIEVDARNASGFTPLMKAALQGRTKCAKILLFAGKLIFFPPSLFFSFFSLSNILHRCLFV